MKNIIMTSDDIVKFYHNLQNILKKKKSFDTTASPWKQLTFIQGGNRNLCFVLILLITNQVPVPYEARHSQKPAHP